MIVTISKSRLIIALNLHTEVVFLVFCNLHFLQRIEKVLQRQSSLKMGAKLVHYLLDHGLMLLKFSSKGKTTFYRKSHQTG